jgi:hemoglobin
VNDLRTNEEEHYEELGKEFFRRVQGDRQLQELLQQFAHEQIKHHPQTFHSHAFGDGQYTNEQVQQAHKHISIDDHHFESMVGHFVQTLDDHGYSEAEKMKAIEMMKGYKENVIGK